MIQPTSEHKEDRTVKDHTLTNVAIGAGITFTGILVGGVLQYLYHILLARYLGPDTLGIFVLGLAVMGIVSSFSRLGLDSGILRYVAMYRGAGDMARAKGTVIEALKLTGIASIAVSILIFIFSSSIAQTIFQRQELSPIIKILALSIPFSVLMALTLATCQAFYIAKYTALVHNFIYPLLNIFLAFLVLMLDWEVMGISSVYVVATLFSFLLAGYYLLRLFPEIKGGHPGIADRKKLFKFSLPLMVISFFGYLILWTDTLMLGFFRTSQEVGIYSAAMKTSMLIVLFLSSFNFIFVPLISDLYNRGEIERLEKIFKTVTRWAITLALPGFIYIVFWAKEIMQVFGTAFISASIPLVILAVGQFINLSTGSVGYMLIMTGRNWIALCYSSLTFVLNVALNYLLIPRYGIIGAAMATASSISVFHILNISTIYSTLKMHPYHIATLKPVLGGLIALGLTVIVVHQIDLEWIGTLVLSLITLTGSYLLILILLSFNEDDKEIIRDVKERICNILGPPTG